MNKTDHIGSDQRAALVYLNGSADGVSSLNLFAHSSNRTAL